MRSVRSLGVLAAILLVAAGCNNQPAGPVVVHGMNVNEYEFDYELVSPSSIRTDSQVLSISTGKNQIGSPTASCASMAGLTAWSSQRTAYRWSAAR